MDSHVVMDLADLANLEAASYGLMLDLQKLVKESISVFSCAACPPISNGNCNVCASLTNSTRVDTREAAIMELTPEDNY